jgi:GTPase SAR1 family protein
VGYCWSRKIPNDYKQLLQRSTWPYKYGQSLVSLANLLLVVYDVTSKLSFDNIKKWLDDVERHASTNIVKLLVGNKADLDNKRQVDFQTAKVPTIPSYY